MNTPIELSLQICKILEDKLAEDIKVLDVAAVTVVADYFIIATGRNVQHVKSLSENIEDKLAENGIEPLRQEGKNEGRWAVLDYGSVIVHIFNDETRLMYSLEKLWGNNTSIKKFPEDF